MLDTQFVNGHLGRLGVAVSLPKIEYHQMRARPGWDADFFAFRGDADPEEVLKLAAVA